MPSYSSTGDPGGALAGFLALGISVLGALRFGRRWLTVYPLVAAAALLVLLLAPDSYAAFGLLFLVAGAAAAVAAPIVRASRRAAAERLGPPGFRGSGSSLMARALGGRTVGDR